MQETKENIEFPTRITQWMVMMKSPKPCSNFKGAFGTDVTHATLIAAKLTATLKIEPWKMCSSAHNVKSLIYQVVVTT